MEFNTIGVCDGIAMGHEGMKYSLVTREIIADSIECMAKAHAFDGLVFIPNCDKNSARYAYGCVPCKYSVYLHFGRAYAFKLFSGRNRDGSEFCF